LYIQLLLSFKGFRQQEKARKLQSDKEIYREKRERRKVSRKILERRQKNGKLKIKN
jgi:hypothetical protein